MAHTSQEPERRLENRAGAWALAVADRIGRRVVATAGGEAEAAALISLRIYDGATIERLRHIAGLSHPGAVRLVDRLEAEGLVERGPGRDARSVALHLTDAGRGRAAEALAERERALEELLAPLGVEERAQLGALLDTLLGALPADRRDLESICRLCDYRACDGNLLGVCPVDRAVIAHETR